MEILFFIIIAAFAGWLGYKAINSPHNNPIQNKESEPEKNENTALLGLQKVMETCQTDHKHASLALTWLASSDGVISQQELRIIVNFCETQGSHFNKSDLKSIDRLNAGLNMKVTGGEVGALENLAEIRSRDIQYRAAVVAAVDAICLANKTINASKKRFQQAARELIN